MIKLNRLTRQGISLVIVLITSVSCEKLEDLREQVEFLDPLYFGICFVGNPRGQEMEVIITDSKSYQEYFNQRRLPSSNINCDTA